MKDKDNIIFGEEMGNKKSVIMSVYKAYKILELFGEKSGLSFAEINNRLDLPQATLYRFLATLITCGLLDVDPKSKLYSLGPSMIYLGNAAVSSIDIVSLARPFMEKLKEETNETISLFIRKGFKKICIAKVESDLSIRYSAKIGEANYLHGGASGNILMAGMTKKELDMLESTIGFPKLTEHTVIDRGKIERILDKTRKDGYWVSYKERRDDTAGIGVPIFNHLGQIVASLNITLPSTRFDEITVEKWIPILKKAGLDISRKNGYYENFAHDSGHLL
ncbi:IclR family transcriptional regulator [Cloacibacillus evryensis]|uniref:IclR family transcriptional regulator n=1 Tax=Cloacibacillus evryensis TaxID=508460 RepID=UPI00370D1631